MSVLEVSHACMKMTEKHVKFSYSSGDLDFLISLTAFQIKLSIFSEFSSEGTSIASFLPRVAAVYDSI